MRARQDIDVPGVEKNPPAVSLSITFDEELPKISSSTTKKSLTKKEATKPLVDPKSLDDLESLEV